MQHAPNANADLFRYGQRYYYQQDGRWYQARNMAGPWQRVKDVPRSFRQVEAPYFKQPPEWAAYRPQLPSGLTPQWTPIPGAPGVHYAPNANTDLFRYGQSYYYQHDGKWYQTRNMAGPWQGLRTSPRVFAGSRPLILSSLQDGPREENGLGRRLHPPGQMKKYERQHIPQGR